MRNKIRRSLWIGSLISLLPIVLGLIYYDMIPETMANHYDSKGNPNGYASKEFAIFILPVLITFLHIIVNISMAKEDLKGNAAKPLIKIGEWAIPVATIITYPFMILKSVGKDSPINTVTIIMVGLILILSGNYFPKNRISPHVGMKFPWLLHDEESWSKTHKLSGCLWIIAGFFLIASSFFTIPFALIFVFIICFTVIIPIFYSLFLHRKRNNNQF